MPSTWKPLPLHREHNDTPPLLVKYEFGLSDYRVWLTDLSYIWTESLDRRQILRRALNVDTSIDPSEDSAQLRLFLASIADALGQRPGTSVDVDKSNDIKQLILQTSTQLPHPLQPLEWSIVLMLAPQTLFASEFVFSLLSQQLTAKVEKTSLIQQLKDKDNIISKLIDKMQGDGVDLGKVFPGAVSSKSGTGRIARRAVAKSVKGLGEFDHDQWEIQLAKDNVPSGDLGECLSQVFDDDGKDTGEGLQTTDYGEWWKTVGHKDSQQQRATSVVRKTDAKQEIVVENEFQRQSTPPKASAQIPRREEPIMDIEPIKPSGLGKKSPNDGSSTTDDSDDDLQSSHLKPLPLHTDDAVASDPANDIKGIQSKPMDPDDVGLTTSASETDHSPVKTHLMPKPKSKPKLGKIGGQGTDSSPQIPAVPKSKPKLGKIGGKDKLGKLGGTGSVSSQNESAASSKPEAAVSPKLDAMDQIAAPKTSEREGRSRSVQLPRQPSPPRETSQERANRKRAQLKRELENKSQAATKKKRRF